MMGEFILVGWLGVSFLLVLFFIIDRFAGRDK
jgi:hypothetical protein